MTAVLEAIQAELTPLHARFKTVSTSHVPELDAEIAGWPKRGMTQRLFSNENHGIFRLAHSDVPPDATSVFIVAVPQGITDLDFHWDDIRAPPL